ncbi:MAG: hypothetical protein KDD39_05485 [Bdellovibrionales bacterium]|nr:hypothetical protein [Bdellovibrionales bacterium]
MEQSFATLIVGVSLFTFATLVNVTKFGQDPARDTNGVRPQQQETLLWNDATQSPEKKKIPGRQTPSKESH